MGLTTTPDPDLDPESGISLQQEQEEMLFRMETLEPLTFITTSEWRTVESFFKRKIKAFLDLFCLVFIFIHLCHLSDKINPVKSSI